MQVHSRERILIRSRSLKQLGGLVENLIDRRLVTLLVIDVSEFSVPQIQQQLHFNFIHAQAIRISHRVLIEKFKMTAVAEVAELHMDHILGAIKLIPQFDHGGQTTLSFLKSEFLEKLKAAKHVSIRL